MNHCNNTQLTDTTDTDPVVVGHSTDCTSIQRTHHYSSVTRLQCQHTRPSIYRLYLRLAAVMTPPPRPCVVH